MLINQRYYSWICALVFALSLADSCLASSITVNYSGDIYYSQIPQIADGSTFTGSVTYSDPERPFANLPGDWDMSAQDQISVDVDGYDFSYTAGSAFNNIINVSLYQQQDVFFLDGSSGTAGLATNYPFSSLNQIDVQFVWPAGTLSPGVIPDPFPETGLQFGHVIGSDTIMSLYLSNGNGIAGLITSVQVSPVPEPRETIVTSRLIGVLIGVA